MSQPSAAPARGTLKIYLGYAAGVGKTYAMLTEAQDLKREGRDVVVGYFEPHGRKDTIALVQGLELVPRRKIEYRGAVFEEMDTAAISRRHPQICAVDEFAHTNVPGSQRVKRWEDVQLLRDAGIDVITTMNVQHIESLNDQVWQITGVRVRETIPDWVVKQADEVVMVDLPPGALLNRLRRGAVYSPEKASQAVQKFFKESTLVVLRELALRQTAHEVDLRHTVQDESQVSESSPGFPSRRIADQSNEVRDRILIYVTPDPSTAMLIRRGRRVADYLHAECFAIAVQSGPDYNPLPSRETETLQKHLNFARNLHVETRILQGDNVAETLVNFARMHQVTQIFLSRPRTNSPLPWFGGNLVNHVVRLARDMQVTIVAERQRSS
jgi:two-component system sensor histidine kinase KdpD